jgi:hypothetical protein
MNDWEKILSKKYGKYYLYNRKTGESIWPSKLRGGADKLSDDLSDDSSSDTGIDTTPAVDTTVDIQQQLDAMTLAERLARKGREIDFEEEGTPPKDRRITYGQREMFKKEEEARKRRKLISDRTRHSLLRQPLVQHQLPAPRINPRQTRHFSDREIEILASTGELPARQEARPPYPAQFRAYLDLMASGAPYRAPPTPEPRPFNPDLPGDRLQPNRQDRQDAFRAHLDQIMARARVAPPDNPRRPNPVIRRPHPPIYRRR